MKLIDLSKHHHDPKHHLKKHVQYDHTNLTYDHLKEHIGHHSTPYGHKVSIHHHDGHHHYYDKHFSSKDAAQEHVNKNFKFID